MKERRKKVVNRIMIGIVLFVILWIGIEEYKEKQIQSKTNESPYLVQNVKITNQIKEETQSKIESNQEEQENSILPNEYKGYLVDAKLEIPKISLETYVLKENSQEALNISVTKFWGGEVNQIGNYCIAGHNFKNKNMFRNLKELKKGDALWITDEKVGKLQYEIDQVYQVYPNDVSCLSQETEGTRQVTLITCTLDSKKRIIVKAKEVSRE